MWIKVYILYWICSTVEDDIIVDQVDSPEIIDDFELGQDEAVDIKDKEVNKQKLRRRIDQYKVILNSHLLLFEFSHFNWTFLFPTRLLL